MTKKKIIAIGSTAVSLLLIAGIGVATWNIMGNKGNINDTVTPPSHVTPPVEGSAAWGTLKIDNPENLGVAFDQTRIVFTYNLVDNEDGYFRIPENFTHIAATWDLGDTEAATPAIMTDVDFFATIYISTKSVSYDDHTSTVQTPHQSTGALTDYVSFVTAGNQAEWEKIYGSSKQVLSATTYSGTTEDPLGDYMAYKYELAVGTSTDSGVKVPLNGQSPAWTNGKINLTFNLDNLLMYKPNKLPTTGKEVEVDGVTPKNQLEDFMSLLNTLEDPAGLNQHAVKVVIEATTKESA